MSKATVMTGPGGILPRAARLYGSKPALVTDDRTLTYVELDVFSDRLAAALADLGLGAGERVVLLSENRWEWVVAYHGILKCGCVVTPLNPMLTDDEVRYVVEDCGASALIASGQRSVGLVSLTAESSTLRTLISLDEPPSGACGLAELLEQPRPRPHLEPLSPDALCTIGYTSGTTGHPKGAMQSHRAVLLNAALMATMHVRTREDTVVTALPAPHVYGNNIIHSLFLAGGTVVLMRRFDPAQTLASIAEHRATLFEGVPTMYAMMLASAEVKRTDLSSLRRSTVGGQTIDVSVIEEWEGRSGSPVLELWGMTELAGAGTTHALYAPNVHGSIGVALPGVQVQVGGLDDDRKLVPAGDWGELLVRGPIVTLGYWGRQAATAELIDADGWLHTGDVAYSDDTGHFYVVDRVKDMIITGGFNVYPAEIERVITQHPAVAMVAIGRVPDQVKGELAQAYVVLRPGKTATEEEIIGHCRQYLAAYKVPRSVRFVDDLPKTSTGKIMRRQLSTIDQQPGLSAPSVAEPVADPA